MIGHRVRIRPLDGVSDMDRYRLWEKAHNFRGLKSPSSRCNLSSTGDHSMRRRIVLLIITPMVDVLGLMAVARNQMVAFIPCLAS